MLNAEDQINEQIQLGIFDGILTKQEIKKTLSNITKFREDRKIDPPYGYTLVNGKLEIKKAEAEVVKWIFESYLKYAKNPPEELVYEVQSYYERKEKISRQGAIRKIDYALLLQYITVELNVRFSLCSHSKNKLSIEDTQYCLAYKLETEKLEKIAKEAVLFHGEYKYEWDIVRLSIANQLYTGNQIYANNQNGKLTLNNTHEVIISNELYEEAKAIESGIQNRGKDKDEKRAIGFVYCSVDKETFCEKQREEIKNYCRKNGYKLEKIYEMVGRKKYDTKDEVYDEMIRDYPDGTILVVSNINRISQHFDEYSAAVDKFRQHELKLESAKESDRIIWDETYTGHEKAMESIKSMCNFVKTNY